MEGIIVVPAGFPKKSDRVSRRPGPARRFIEHQPKSAMLRSKISPCLWFDGQAEPAARFYISIFKDSKIQNISYYCGIGEEHHGQKAGTVMAVGFQIEGQTFTALNGGPIFKISEAISFQIDCHSQEEIDYYWEKLNEGGDPECQACGWLKDKFGVSWQVVPAVLLEMILDPDTKKAQRAVAAMMKMKKLDIAALKAAYDG
jgi:predicted 3-demethylubiquinone-9 3-methyltransferase (glyoxalase superfamily)